MPDAPILPDDESVSQPSERTMRGGDPATLGRIDHYDLLCKLGGGGFGVVYLARDTASGIEVALKTLHPLLKRNAEEMDLLREKFRLVHGLTHPNIAKALVIHLVREINIRDEAARAELKLSPGDSVMVMDYAPGVTLSKWRRQFPGGIVPFDLALEIGRQVAAALDYAHGEKIVHRDIKPSNVMVETVAAEPRPLDHGQNAARSLSAPTLRVRILDFGLAAEIRSSMSRVSTESGDTSGTRPYMAPEQWLGKKQDGRTDQYALACVLYELLSGAPPFAGVFETGDPVIMRTAVTTDAPDEIKDTDSATNEALLRALAKDPKDRFSTCAAFVAALSSTTEQTDNTEGGASRPGEPQGQAALEADVLRRKVALSRALAGISAEDRVHALFGPPTKEAETELAATEEAFKWNRFAAAAACLSRAETALARLRQARQEELERLRRENEEAERLVREKAERLVREKAERERKAREEEERLVREEAEREKAELIRREAEDRARRERAQQEKIAAWERQRQKRLCIWRGRIRKVGLVALALGMTLVVLHTVGTWSAPASRSEAVANKSIPLGFLVSLEMVHCPGVSPDFWMGKYEVTQEQWKRVMGSNPSNFKGSKKPVECVSWDDCQAFVKKLNELPAAKESGLVFRLPTEEEWETACRAGAPESAHYCKLADGTQITESNLPRVAWFDDNSNNQTHPVGQKVPNAWGLHDMHGNVWEWTQTGGAHTGGGDFRVYRGGSFNFSPDCCTAGFLAGFSPDLRIWTVGFRLAASGRTAAASVKPEATARTSDGQQAARSAAASRSSARTDTALPLGSGVSLEMIACPGVAPDFWMGKYEVTQEQWARVMGSNPSHFKGAKKPVEFVSWNDCQEFVRKLNAMPVAKASGLTFRLPTEEEWETACRAGAPKSENYCKLADGTQITEAKLSRVAWFGKKWEVGPTEAGKNRKPNAWDIYDMHGNVWEWTQTADGDDRVSHGGGFGNSAFLCTAGYRCRDSPDSRNWYLGFRLAASGRTAAK